MYLLQFNESIDQKLGIVKRKIFTTTPIEIICSDVYDPLHFAEYETETFQSRHSLQLLLPIGHSE